MRSLKKLLSTSVLRGEDSKSKENKCFEEEYICTIRRKSYEEVRAQAQKHRKTTYVHLLEPKQEILYSVILSSTHIGRHRSILLDYFDFTFRACNLCCTLIDSVDRARANHAVLRRALELNELHTCEKKHLSSAATNIQCFYKLDNPFGVHSTSPLQFEALHRTYAPTLRRLAAAHREAVPRLKRTRFAAKVICWIEICGLGITLEDLGAVEDQEEQLESAARGAFTLEKDLDMMSYLVRMLRDEIEHGRDVIGLFVDEMEEELVLREVVRELQEKEGKFMDQLAELEEYVYLCFLNINRARMMVVKAIIADDRPYSNYFKS